MPTIKGKPNKKGKKARQRQQEQGRYWILGTVGVVLAAVIVLALVGLHPFGRPATQDTAALETAQWTHTLKIVNEPVSQARLPELLPHSKQIADAPVLLYIGAEYCPYCAASRWAMVTALSHFGRFTKLDTMESSSTDVYPDTHTWTFFKSRYTSNVVKPLLYEIATRQGPSYPLQKVPEPYISYWEALDIPPQVPTNDEGAIPFILVGGKYLWIGSLYSPAELTGVSWPSIIQSVKHNLAPMGPSINANADMLTAAMCTVNSDYPASVCENPTIRVYEAALKRLKPGS